MTAAFRLSVLDQSPISEGSTEADALARTVDLARLVDGLGYHRYWVAEHHGMPMLASPRPESPEVWLLGSSAQSAIWAAELGLPYAFADFINPTGARLTQTYRARFTTSGRLHAPYVAVTVAAICADSDDEAERLAASTRMAITMLRRGNPIEVPSVEKAIRFLATDGTTAAERSTRRIIAGSPPTVRAGLEQVASDYGADEVVVVTITHDHAARRRSYELIADLFGAGDAEARDA